MLPRVPLYVIGYACLKGCIYGILFWLPTFLEHKNLGNEKGYISDMIDLGALVGGAIVGILVDYFDKRSIFLSPLLFVCSIVMFVISFAGSDAAWVYYLGMLLIGILLGGPYNIIGTVIAIDIGQQSGTANNVTSVSSLIEGTAALFAAISQFANSYLGESIFYLFAVECIVAAAVLVPLLITEIKAIRGKTKTK